MRSTRRPPNRLERTLVLVLGGFIALNLLLIVPAFASEHRLDRLHPSLPVVNLRPLAAGRARITDGLGEEFTAPVRALAGELHHAGAKAFNSVLYEDGAAAGNLSGPMETPTTPNDQDSSEAPIVAVPSATPMLASDTDPDDSVEPTQNPSPTLTSDSVITPTTGLPSPTVDSFETAVVQTATALALPKKTKLPPATATQILAATSTPIPGQSPTSTSPPPAATTQAPTLAPSQTSVSAPTNTPVPPKKTKIPPPTSTPLPSPTSTSIPPTVAPSHTPTFAPTATHTLPPTNTAIPTATATKIPSQTPTSKPLPPSSTPLPDGNFYVATNGNDSAPGTSGQPWRTIQHAANAVSPGNTVIVLAGDYPERVFVNRSGASGAPIAFRAQGTVTMRGFTVKANHISLIGFDISNTPDNWANGWGIFLEGSNCTIIDNYVHFATRGGIALYTAPGEFSQTSNCVVRDNRLYRNAMTGLSVRGRNHLVEGNEIWGTIQYHPNWNNAPNWVDADGIRFHGSGHTIRGNYIHDISLQDPENIDPHIDCFQTWSDAESEAARDIILEQNRCENLNVGMYAFMLEDARDLIIRNNIIQAFAGVNTGGGGNSYLTIVNNVFASDLALSSGSQSTGIELESAPNATIKNNIFYNFNSHIILTTGNSNQGLDAGFNSAYRSDGEPVVGSPYPNDLWDLDPLFVNPGAGDFHLKPDSRLVDAGQPLASVSDDFNGAPRPQGSGYDIGTFERAP